MTGSEGLRRAADAASAYECRQVQEKLSSNDGWGSRGFVKSLEAPSREPSASLCQPRGHSASGGQCQVYKDLPAPQCSYPNPESRDDWEGEEERENS